MHYAKVTQQRMKKRNRNDCQETNSNNNNNMYVTWLSTLVPIEVSIHSNEYERNRTYPNSMLCECMYAIHAFNKSNNNNTKKVDSTTRCRNATQKMGSAHDTWGANDMHNEHFARFIVYCYCYWWRFSIFFFRTILSCLLSQQKAYFHSHWFTQKSNKINGITLSSGFFFSSFINNLQCLRAPHSTNAISFSQTNKQNIGATVQIVHLIFTVAMEIKIEARKKTTATNNKRL